MTEQAQTTAGTLGGVAMGAGALAAGTAQPHPDAMLIEAFQGWLAIHLAHNAVCSGDRDRDNAFQQECCTTWGETESLIAGKLAGSPFGIALKLRVVLFDSIRTAKAEDAYLASGGTDLEPESILWPGALLVSAIRDLERMAVAGGAATNRIGAARTADPHAAWLAEYRRLRDLYNTSELAEDSPEWHRHEELEALIASTPADTASGMLAQIDLALEWIEFELRGHKPEEREQKPEVMGLRNVARTIERLFAADEARLGVAS